METSYEIISTAILPLRLIQEGQLPVTGESKCQSTDKPLGRLSMSVKSKSKVTDRLDMTLIVLTGP